MLFKIKFTFVYLCPAKLKKKNKCNTLQNMKILVFKIYSKLYYFNSSPVIFTYFWTNLSFGHKFVNSSFKNGGGS